MTNWLERIYEDATAGRLGPAAHPVFRWLVEAVHVVIVLVRETMRDRLHVRAAMLAYWSAVAIVPILLLGFALTGPLGLTATTADAVKRLLYDSILASSVNEVSTVLDDLLVTINLRTLGILGVGGIMLIGAQLFFNAELAYNDIFRVRVRRSRVLRFTLFYAGITLGPLLIAGGFVLTAKLGQVASIPVVGRLAPVVLTATALVGAIRMLPCSDVAWRAALSGGIVSAVLFETAKFGFGAYTDILGTRDNMTLIYGSVAFLPVFLLWLYVLWLVVLFGVEVAFLVQHHGSLIDAQRRLAVDRHARRRHPDGFFAVAVMAAIADRFGAGRGGLSAGEVATETGADLRHVQITLDVLEDAALLIESDDKRFLPARPPEQITMAEVLRAWRDLAAPRVYGSAAGAFRLAVTSIDGAMADNIGTLAGNRRRQRARAG